MSKNETAPGASQGQVNVEELIPRRSANADGPEMNEENDSVVEGEINEFAAWEIETTWVWIHHSDLVLTQIELIETILTARRGCRASRDLTFEKDRGRERLAGIEQVIAVQVNEDVAHDDRANDLRAGEIHPRLLVGVDTDRLGRSGEADLVRIPAADRDCPAPCSNIPEGVESVRSGGGREILETIRSDREPDYTGRIHTHPADNRPLLDWRRDWLDGYGF